MFIDTVWVCTGCYFYDIFSARIWLIEIFLEYLSRIHCDLHCYRRTCDWCIVSLRFWFCCINAQIPYPRVPVRKTKMQSNVCTYLLFSNIMIIAEWYILPQPPIPTYPSTEAVAKQFGLPGLQSNSVTMR